MAKFIVDLELDGYDTQDERDKAAAEFIYDQLNTTASSVKIERAEETLEKAWKYDELCK